MLTPFAGLLVRPDWASRVLPPPFDALTPGERAAIAAANPDSFLHVTGTLEDLPAEPADSGVVLTRARIALDRLLAAGAYQRFDDPALFVYRISHAGRQQTGIVGALAASAFAGDRVRLHEDVNDRRVEMLARHVDEVGVVSSPIALGYRSAAGVDPLLHGLGAQPALLDLAQDDGTTHTVWRVSRTADVLALQAALAGSVLYVTDGHHRVAAAVRAAAVRDGTADDRVLVVCFPHDQLRVLPFHRRLRGPVGDVGGSLRSLDGVSVGPAGAPHRIDERAITVYADRRWWHVRPEGPRPPGVAGLLVTVLHRDVLAPGFGVIGADDPALDLVSGLVPAPAIADRCDADGGAAFLLPPPRIEDVFDVADRGESMPAKSTFFHPKPRSGMFLLPR